MKRFAFFAAALLLFTSCVEVEDTPESKIQSGELIVTSEASDITQNSAKLWGYVNLDENPRGPIGCIISLSDTPSEKQGTIIEVSRKKIVDNKFYVDAVGLTASTKYYYRAWTQQDGINRYGEVKSFTTDAFSFAAIDLGLSVNWANANLGATSPEDYGDYYSWGETNPKENYDWSTYKFGYDPVYSSCFKYNVDDRKKVLDKDDDAAHVKLGGKWRMPTLKECQEFAENCSSRWTSQNGVYGRLFTSKTEGTSIFIPASGFRSGVYLRNDGRHGYVRFWTSSLASGSSAWYFHVWEDNAVYFDNGNRSQGMPIRAVCSR